MQRWFVKLLAAVIFTVATCLSAQAATIVSFDASPTTSPSAGGSVTFTVTMSDGGASGASVEIKDLTTNTILGNATISGATATLQANVAGEGTHQIRASYTDVNGTSSLTTTHTVASSNPTATITSFTSSPSSLGVGGGWVTLTVTMSDDSASGRSVSIDNGVGTLTINGTTATTQVYLATSTNFIVSYTTANGTATQQLAVSVATPPTTISSFTSTPPSLGPGGGWVTLTATMSDGSASGRSVSIDHGVGARTINGRTATAQVYLTTSTTFTLTYTTANGTLTEQLQVVVDDPTATINGFSSSATNLPAGGGWVTLTATLSNNTASGGTVSFGAAGSAMINGNTATLQVYVASTRTFTASYTTVHGTTSQQLTVVVASAGPTVEFVVSAPSAAITGTPFDITVTARAASGIINAGYSGTVHFTSSDGTAVLPADSTLTDGIGTFSVTLNSASTSSITATDTVSASITGSASVTANATGTLASFIVSPSTLPPGGGQVTFTATMSDSSASGQTIEIRDADTNTVLGTPTITGATATLTATVSGAGVHQFEARHTNVNGTTTLATTVTVATSTATLVSLSSSPSILTAGGGWVTLTAVLSNTSASGGTVSFGVAGTATINGNTAILQVYLTQTTTFTASYSDTNGTTTQQVTVSVDAPTAVIQSFSGTPNTLGPGGGWVTLTVVLNNTTASSRTVSFGTAGSATINGNTATLDVYVTQTRTFTASYTNASGTVNAQTTITVASATATLTGFSSSSVNLPAGGGWVTLTATLSNGTANGQTVEIKTGSTLVGSPTINGDTASLQVYVNSTRTFVASFINGATTTSQSETVAVAAAGPATYLAVSAPANATAGSAVSVSVTARDASNNTVTGYSGTVQFTSTDGAASLPAQATLSNGTGTFTVTLRSIGSQSITATDTVTPSITGTTGAITVSAVVVPPMPEASKDLALIQNTFSVIAGRASGRAVSGAVSKGIAVAFGGESDVEVGSQSAFMAYVPTSGSAALAGIVEAEHASLNDGRVSLWLDATGSGLLDLAQGRGNGGWQVNLTGGIGYRITDDVVVGALTGYEVFHYKSDRPQGTLNGEGYSVGAYMGARPAEDVLVDLSVAWTGLGYKAESGGATGTFGAGRWLISGGLSGSFELGDGLTVTPSGQLSALWEEQKAWTDSLGSAHAERDVGVARASVGLQVSDDLPIAEDWKLVPYLGGYLDLQASYDSAGVVTPGSDPVAGRVRAGVNVQADGGAGISLGGEAGGLGTDLLLWSLEGRLRSSF